MGNKAISNYPGMEPIILYLQSKGLYRLNQISQWDIDTQAWKGWSFPPIPDNLKEIFNNFQIYLHNIVPITKNGIDGLQWDPTGSSFSIQAGYHYLYNRDHPTSPWMYWKAVWKSEAIPKVKFFTWTLLKGKTLTSENLQKRGIIGPSRCPNCHEAEETMQHLFISCPFAISWWKGIASIDTFTWNPQHSIGEALSNWKKSYP